MFINKEELTIGDIIKKSIENEILKIHTSIPAKIVKIDLTKRLVNVQPLINYFDKITEKYIKLPIIPNVPIMFLRTKVALISVPINIEDTGTLFFSERCFKNWQLSGGIKNTEDNRHHNITDAYFMPSILYDGQGLSLNTSLQIILKNGKVIIGDDGKIEIEGPEIKLGSTATEKAVLGDELLSVLEAFIDEYDLHTHGRPTPTTGIPTEDATPITDTILATKTIVE